MEEIIGSAYECNARHKNFKAASSIKTKKNCLGYEENFLYLEARMGH
jgi:hypothetical protein